MATGLFNANASSVTLECNGVTAMIAKDTGVLGAGTAGVSGNDVVTIGQLGFSKFYESPEQVITLAATTSLSHGLPSLPKITQLSLVCKVAELGCTVGEEINLTRDANNSSSGADVFRSSTTLRVVVGAVAPNIFNASGSLIAITPANWRFIVRAWA